GASEPRLGRLDPRGDELDRRRAGAPSPLGSARGRGVQRPARRAAAGEPPGRTFGHPRSRARRSAAPAIPAQALPVAAGRRRRGRRPILAPPRATILVVVWVSLAVANGLYFSFSVFLPPLVEEFRWSRALTSGALSLSTVVQGALAPVAGLLVDRLGPRRVILAGVGFLSAAALLAATVRGPWELYLYTGLLGAVGLVGLGPVPMGVLLSRWFSQRRGRAVGVAFSGMGAGVFVTGPLAQWLIGSFGWRAATATLGAGALAILLPLVWLGAHDPRPRRNERS